MSPAARRLLDDVDDQVRHFTVVECEDHEQAP